MLAPLRRFIARHQLISPGDRVIAAVSGGADSVCLFRLLLELRHELGFVLSVAHFDHQLRPDSAADAAFVAQLAVEYNCESHLGSGDVRTHAALHHQSLETAARNLRYAFFDSLLDPGRPPAGRPPALAGGYSANENPALAAGAKLATAHTQTDQAETVLMKLLRGAGPRGLAAIHPLQSRERGSIIRPLLFASRAEIEDHLRSLDQPWREDPSNAELAHTRNRVRHQLMPLLREFNPEADAALAQTADILRAEEDYLQQETTRALPFVLLPGAPVRGGGRATTQSPAFALSLEALARHPLALQRRLVREALHPLCTLTLADTDRILSLQANKRLELPAGIRVRRLHRELQILPAEPNPIEPAAYEAHAIFDGNPLTLAAGPVTLRISGQVTLPLPLTLRNWRPGDRFHAPHTRAPKKVKEHLQRLKLTPEERAQWPVLVSEASESKEILWLRGFPSTRSVKIEEIAENSATHDSRL